MKTRGFCIGLCLGLLLVEVGYRAYLHHRYAVDVNFVVSTQDNPAKYTYIGTPNAIHGNYEPGVGTWTRYAVDGARFSKLRIAINNLGWRSRFDYALDKKRGEYRIAIVGDSIAASVTNEQAWPDLLQDELNADSGLLAKLGATSITVVNLSTQGAGLNLMANELTDTAKRLSADQLIVNFPIEAIARRGAPIVPSDQRNWNPGPETPLALPEPEVEVEDVKILLWNCEAPRRLENPSCRVNPSWIVPKGSDLSANDITRIKHKLAELLVWGRVVKTFRPLAIYELAGMPVIPRTDAQAAGSRAVNEADDIERAVDALSTVREIFSDALIVHSPMYWHLYPTQNPNIERLERLSEAALARGVDITDMRKFMPLGGGKDEWYRWYNLPNDGHFSDYGSAIYAGAMHKAIAAHVDAWQPVD